MGEQLAFFENQPGQNLPPGFGFRTEFISARVEAELVECIRGLSLREFEFRGYVGKRRTVSFGWSYDFVHESLTAAEPIPACLTALRCDAAEFANIAPDNLEQVLVTEYTPGAEIGWHRDKAVFGVVVGVSLLSACRFRLRRKTTTRWERVTIDAPARSAYVLSGASRHEWEHSIPAVEHLRYSVTFRSLR